MKKIIYQDPAPAPEMSSLIKIIGDIIKVVINKNK